LRHISIVSRMMSPSIFLKFANPSFSTQPI
jgi:hypothetical protein